MATPTPNNPMVFSFTDGSTIIDNQQTANFNQLFEDCNANMTAMNLQLLDEQRWDVLAQEIATLVAIAGEQERTAMEKSLIYGRLMIIVTAQYLPVVSEYLGDQIAQQAAIQDIASDISSFLADAQNGFNSLASSGSTSDTDSQIGLFGGATAVTGAVSGADNTAEYDFSFTVTFLKYDETSETYSEETQFESSVLNLLTDTYVWGNTTPLSSDGSSQISTAFIDIYSIFNSGEDQTTLNSWFNRDLTALADATYTWTQVYGSSSGNPCEGDVPTADETSSTCDVGPENAPLVYTEPNSIQSDMNQATQTVQTVATSTQTIQNFQVQEINQYYGIINSIQQSQQSQNSSIVKKQVS